MNVWLNLSTLMPCRKESTAGAATMLDILKRIHHVRDEAQQPCQTACDASPDTAVVSTLSTYDDARNSTHWVVLPA